ncbi:unnamed protein product [Durusdinium trenchii]|uniref:Leucine-rich repeat-containing protein 74A (Leucine-rich repeat-containing protein 74) n=2 Tax=Durusdinium trenchii TaxID=1381693 RepID=A0ABP0I960_9DINO
MVPQLERSLQLQDEIIQAYQQKAPELRRFAQKIKAGGSVAALQAAEEREAFLLELQKPLVARYGFEESAKGVRDAMVEYADIAENNLVTKRHNHMERLLAGGEDIDLYLGVPAQQAIRNFGTRRPAPPSQFPLVAREDFEKSFEGRRLPVPRKDMLAANTTEELAAACKRGDTLRAEALLGQSGVVNIGFHGLGPAGAKTLAQVISPKLEALELDITGNGIGPEGVKALASKIPKNLKVLKLNLSRNRLTLAGVKAIAASIPKSVEVLSLGFSGMKMGAAGAAALAEAIPPQVKDLSLDLFGNKIGDDGMDLISKALPKSLELLHVVLQQNDLSRRGFFMLDRQIGDPLNQRFLPKLKPENFIKSGEVDVTEFKEEADGTIHRQVEWQRVI